MSAVLPAPRFIVGARWAHVRAGFTTERNERDHDQQPRLVFMLVQNLPLRPRIPYNMHMRAAFALILVAGCGAARPVPYKLASPELYEVGEDATILLTVKQVSDDDAQIVITRPDGSIVKENAPLDTDSSRIRFGKPPPHPGIPPTFTMKGAYKVELKVDDQVLAKSELVITSNHIDDLLPIESVADYKQITRYTRPKVYGKTFEGKSYGAIYSPPWRVEARVQITIDEPKKHLAETWKSYAEEGAMSEIEGNNVIFRERSESVTASWFSGDKIIRMQAPTMPDLEKGIIGHFL